MIPAATRPEREIVRAVLDYLRAVGVPAWRVNTGMAWNARGQPVRFGLAGMPDIAGVLPPAGTALFIEVKRPGQRLAPHQAARLEELRQAGAVAFVATSVSDVVGALAREGAIMTECPRNR